MRISLAFDTEQNGQTLCLILKESIDLAGGTIVGNNGEALVVHVQNQVLTLHR